MAETASSYVGGYFAALLASKSQREIVRSFFQRCCKAGKFRLAFETGLLSNLAEGDLSTRYSGDTRLFITFLLSTLPFQIIYPLVSVFTAFILLASIDWR